MYFELLNAITYYLKLIGRKNGVPPGEREREIFQNGIIELFLEGSRGNGHYWTRSEFAEEVRRRTGYRGEEREEGL